MARTTHSTGLQTTTGPVPTAVLPTDPVPLSQSGGGTWVGNEGVQPAISVSKQYIWVWNADINIAKPFNFPFNARLKEVYWRMWEHSASRLLVKRGNSYTTVATIESNVPQQLDIPFGPEIMIFQTESFIKATFRWQIAAKWEIQGAAPALDTMGVLPNTAPAEPDTESERIPTPLSQPPEQLTQPVESHKTNRFAAWIRRQRK